MCLEVLPVPHAKCQVSPEIFGFAHAFVDGDGAVAVAGHDDGIVHPSVVGYVDVGTNDAHLGKHLQREGATITKLKV